MGRKKASKLPVESPEAIFADLKQKLHTSRVPDRLPCRENEFNDIFNFLEGKLKEGVGG